MFKKTKAAHHIFQFSSSSFFLVGALHVSDGMDASAYSVYTVTNY
jgi:hypothetical protein